MNVQQTINALIEVEVDGNVSPILRRLLRDERMALQAAMQGTVVSGRGRVVDGTRIAERLAEVRRVADLWVENEPRLARIT